MLFTLENNTEAHDQEEAQVCIVTVQLKYFVDFCMADCLLQKCNHKRAYKWVECEKCFTRYVLGLREIFFVKIAICKIL